MNFSLFQLAVSGRGCDSLSFLFACLFVLAEGELSDVVRCLEVDNLEAAAQPCHSHWAILVIFSFLPLFSTSSLHLRQEGG